MASEPEGSGVDSKRGSSINTSQLRASIPSGRTATIDSAREPAAAPFDTDDEAAGRPAQKAAIEQALAHEGRLPVQAPTTASAGLPGSIWIVAAVLAIAVLVFIAVS